MTSRKQSSLNVSPKTTTLSLKTASVLIGCACLFAIASVTLKGDQFSEDVCVYLSNTDCRGFLDSCQGPGTQQSCLANSGVWCCTAVAAPPNLYCIPCGSESCPGCTGAQYCCTVYYACNSGGDPPGPLACQWGTTCDSGQCYCSYTTENDDGVMYSCY
jgi:hypothetical protein